MPDDIQRLAERLRAAQRITILTGAGVSAASGVPTFRGAGGLWRNVRAEDLATRAAFERDPQVVWEWYAWRRELIASCRPNAAHEVIARWSAFAPGAPAEKSGSAHGAPADKPGSAPGAPGDSSGSAPGAPADKSGSAHGAPAVKSDPSGGRVSVITQNVDDLHVRAVTRGLVRLHGSIWELSCAGRPEASGYKAGGTAVAGRLKAERHGGPRGCGAAWRDERVPLPELPPRCESCGGLARPAVVWFGESLAPADAAAAIQACQCDVFLTIGTSAVVYPAAGLVHEAAGRGAFTVEINAEATPASSMVNLAVQGAAEEILPRLDRMLTWA